MTSAVDRATDGKLCVGSFNKEEFVTCHLQAFGVRIWLGLGLGLEFRLRIRNRFKVKVRNTRRVMNRLRVSLVALDGSCVGH